MMTAKIFENGRSQAVRLPKEYRFSSDEVIVDKIGDATLFMPKEKWSGFLDSLSLFTDDLMNDGRQQQTLQERGPLRNTCSTQISVFTPSNLLVF